MQRTFLSNLFLLIIINLLVKPIWVLVIDVKVQNTLGPEAYGDFFSLLNFAFLFSVVLDFGLNNFNNRRLAQNPEIASKVLPHTGLIKLFLGVGFMATVYLFSFLLGYSVEERNLLGAITVMLILQSVLIFLRTNLSGIQWYRADVLVSALDKALMIVIIGSMVFGSVLETEFSIYQFIYGQCVAYLIASIVVLILLVIRIKKFSFSFKRAEIVHTFKSSLPFALLTFLMLIYFKIDAVMIERMLPDGDLQTGYYAQAYKLLDASVMFALLFSTLLLPMFSNMISRNESVVNLVKLSSKLMLIPAVIGVVILCSVGDELLPLMFKTGSAYSSEIFPYLILTLIPLGASYVFGTLITAEGDMRFLNKIALLAILVNVVMNGILIGEYGIMGAAVATLVTQTLVSLIQWRCAAVKFKIPYELAHLLRVIVFVVGLVMSSFIINYLDIDWKLESLVILMTGVILSFSLRLIKKSDFTALKNYQRS